MKLNSATYKLILPYPRVKPYLQLSMLHTDTMDNIKLYTFYLQLPKRWAKQMSSACPKYICTKVYKENNLPGCNKLHKIVFGST